VVTVVSMGVGALVLMAVGLASQGLPRLSWKSWGIIVWLAVINTAFAFTLWNHTLRRLTAVESSLINNTMLIQIALLAWVFLGESLSPKGIAGIVVAAVGVLLVQLARPKSSNERQQES
jgi:drug/metabolite transporter (DMT)-like permease